MAKKVDKEAEENTEQEIKTENEPEKPKKSSELKLPVILGIIFGSLVILILAVRFLFLPYLVENLATPAEAKDSHSKSEKSAAHNDETIGDEKNTEFIQTGRITTNPKMSSQFVVVDLGLLFVPKDEEAMKKLNEGAEKPKEGEGGGLPPKIAARIKGNVNSVLGSLTVEDLQSRRDSLPLLIKENLKPLFKEKNLYLKDVILQEFIIQ